MFSRFFSPPILFNVILLISFSLSVNTSVEIKNLNTIFYIFFYIIFIYILFYHYHYYLYFIGLFYGVLYDVILLNVIGCHLLSFMLLISIYILFKKYLLLLTPYQISIIIYSSLIITLLIELLFAFLFNDFLITISKVLEYFIFSIIIFIPSIYMLSKLDK